MSEFTKPCEYCGTLLNDHDEEESNVAACGTRMAHYASVCRERVHAALRYERTRLAAAERERTELLAENARLREALETLFAGTRDPDARGMGHSIPVELPMPASTNKRVREIISAALAPAKGGKEPPP